MRGITSKAKRCLSMLLAIVMLVGCLSGLTLIASAAELTVTDGELIAANYDAIYGFSAEEKAILNSKLLGGSTYTFEIPDAEDNLITVDPETNTVEAAGFEEWIPTQAVIVAGGAEQETVALAQVGDAYTGTYTYAGNAFSVKVTYTLKQTVETETQQNLLKTIEWVWEDLAKIENLKNETDILDELELAMETLVNIADNGYQVGAMTANFNQTVKDSIYALNAEMTANDGKLTLSKMFNEFDAGAVKFLLTQGAEFKQQVSADTEYIRKIAEGCSDVISVSEMLPGVDAGLISLAELVVEHANEWCEIADVVTAVDWFAANEGTALVKAGITDVEYAALDTFFAAVTAYKEVNESQINPELTVATAEIMYNMSMSNVTVEYVLETVDKSTNTVKVKDTNTVLITLEDGASAAVVLAEIAATGIEADSEAEWAALGYAEDKFDVTTTDLPDALAGDVTYTVTYSPKYYDVTYVYGGSETVPYGYQITLPVHADSEKAYDYTVNGEPYAQGAVVTVEGATTIDRTTGKAYTPTSLWTLAGANYGNPDVQNILASDALVGDVAMKYRVLSTTENADLVTLEGDVLKAADYASDYNGLNWEPYSYEIVGGTEAGTYFFGGSNQVTITAEDFDSINVIYRLTFTGTAAGAADAIALAIALADEAQTQKDTLDDLYGINSTLGSLEGGTLNLLKNMIESSDIYGDFTEMTSAGRTVGEALKECFTTAITEINANHKEGDYLRIYNILNQYGEGGLLYYYKNSAAVIDEINGLSSYLTMLVGADDELSSDDKIDGLTALIDSLGSVGEPAKPYIPKLSSVEAKMLSVKNALTAPNAAIDLSSSDSELTNLINALVNAAPAETAAPADVYVNFGTFTVTAPDTATVKVIVYVGDTEAGSTVKSVPGTDLPYTLIQGDVDDLLAAADAYKPADSDLYNAAWGVSGQPAAGIELATGDSYTYTYTWTIKEFTVSIAGEDDQIVSVNNLKVTLPKHDDPAFRYDYSVAGSTINVKEADGSYTFTKAQLLSLFVNDKYEITRTAINIADEENAEQEAAKQAFKDAILNQLNFDAGNGAKFEWVPAADPAKEDVLQLTVAGDSLMGAAMDAGTGLIMFTSSEYNLIVDGEPVIANMLISLQSLVDTIIKTGLDAEDLIKAGKNNKLEIELDNVVITKGAVAQADVSEVITSMKLIVNGLPEIAKTLLAYLEKAVNTGYIDFTCNATTGEIDVTVDLPEKVYSVYVLALAMTDNTVEVGELNAAVDKKVAYEFVADYLRVLLGSDVRTTTYVNTAAKLGINIESAVASYKSIIDTLIPNVKVDTALQVSEDGYKLPVTATAAQIEKALGKVIKDQALLDQAKNLIKELKEGTDVTVTATASVKDFGNTKNAEAIVIDVEAAKAPANRDKLHVIDFPANLAARLEDAKGYTAVMLQKDVNGPLVFNGATILDLNGHTVNGSITAKATLVIVDSTLDDQGVVTGTVSGSSVSIVGGSYPGCDVSSFIKTGYKLDGNKVVNELYTIEATGTDEYTVKLNSDFATMPNKAMALALAADLGTDVAFKFYDAAAMSINGNKMYEITFEDLLALYGSTGRVDKVITEGLSWIDFNGIKAFANKLSDDILDFDAVVANGYEIVTYTAATNPWKLAVEHKTAGDYFDVSIVADTVKTKNVTLKVVLDGVLAQNLYNELADIATADANLGELTVNYTAADKLVKGTVSGDASVVLDLTGAKNADYIAVIAVALAEGGYTELLDAVKAGKSTAEQKAAFDNVTVKDVFDALKALNRNDNFTTMASGHGLTVDPALNAAYKKLAVAAGWALEKLDITGGSQKMGALDADNDGIYKYSKTDFTRTISRDVRGYTFSATGTVTSASLSVALFGTIPAPTMYTVTYVAGDGSGKPYEVEVEAGTEHTILGYLDCGFAAPEGKEFEKWTIGGAEYAPGDKITVNGNITVTAGWKQSILPPGPTYYTVVVNYGSGDGSYKAGDTVNITAEDRVGRKFTYWAADSNDVAFVDYHSKTTSFVMPAHDVEITAYYRVNGGGTTGGGGSAKKCTCCLKDCPGNRFCGCDGKCHSAKFTDLDTTKWYHEYTDYAICRGLMNGVEETLFNPNGYTTRAMIITTLYRIDGEPTVVGTNPYTDVENDTWYTDAIIWGTSKGIIDGYGDGLYGPNDAVTREQIATIFYRYAKYKNIGTDLSIELDDYADGDTISTWAIPGMRWAVASGLIEGTSEVMLLLDPMFKTTRAQTATLLTRWCREFAK